VRARGSAALGSRVAVSVAVLSVLMGVGGRPCCRELRNAWRPQADGCRGGLSP
jgi:hypothetical protein